MTDWADGIETRNFGIKSEMNAGMLSEFMRNIIPLAMVAVALLCFSWVRSQILNTGYEIQSLSAAEESLLKIQKRLKLEEDTLTSPEKIDFIARNELGMTTLRPSQFILPPPQDSEPGPPNTMAMAGPEVSAFKASAKGVPGFIPVD